MDHTGDHPVLHIGIPAAQGGGVTVDSELSNTSTNPVQNKVIAGALSSQSETMVDLNSTINQIAEFRPGTNLNNPETMTIGYMISWSGNPDAASGYNLSDFIPVTPGEKYSVGVYKPEGALYKTRTIIAFYDANKAFVAGSVTNIDNVEGLLVTAPEGAAFARVSGHTNFGNETYGLMIAESETILTSFSPYHETATIIADIPVLDDLAHLAGSTVARAKNHYNPETSTEGFLQYNGAIIESPSGQHYSVSDFIPVKPNTTYYVTGYNSSFEPSATRLVAACYDENKAFAFNTYINTDSTVSISINTQNYKYIRVCANSELANRHLMVSEGALPDMFQEYDLKTYSTLYVEQDKTPDYPVLFGKKWAVCGDSFSNSGGTGTTLASGKYKGRPFTYPWIIGNRNDMDIIKFFEGGRTLAFPAEPGSFANSLTNPSAAHYYQNIPEDADYITIYLGINDEHHAPNSSGGDGEDNTGEIPLGTIDDATTATYYGAWNVVLTWLITNRPNAHIGIIVTNGLTIADYRDAQIAIAQKYGIPYIDLNGDARTPAMLRTVNTNIPSAIKQALIAKWAVDPTGEGGEVNTHPNDAAQLFESTFIENFLKSI